jgi:hypothetical protein
MLIRPLFVCLLRSLLCLLPPPSSAAAAVHQTQTGRWQLTRSSETGVWGYTRRAEEETTPPQSPQALPPSSRKPPLFYVGLNHWEAVTRCEPEDNECARADLMNQLYHGNYSLAATAATQQFKRWGFTGAGYNSPTEMEASLPYYSALFMLGGYESNHGGAGPNPWRPHDLLFLPDPWNSSTISRIRATAAQKCAHASPNRHNNLGYLLTDFPDYDIVRSQQRFGGDWVSALRCSGADAPGRLKYVAFLQSRYRRVEDVCGAYSLPASVCARGWNHLDLCRVKNTLTPLCLSDDYMFLPQIADQLYSTATAAIRA